MELATSGIILLNINHLHIQKWRDQYIYNIITGYRILQVCIILILPQTGIKVNLWLQEAIIIYNPNLEYAPSTQRVQAEYKPIPEI